MEGYMLWAASTSAGAPIVYGHIRPISGELPQGPYKLIMVRLDRYHLRLLLTLPVITPLYPPKPSHMKDSTIPRHIGPAADEDGRVGGGHHSGNLEGHIAGRNEMDPPPVRIGCNEPE